MVQLRMVLDIWVEVDEQPGMETDLHVLLHLFEVRIQAEDVQATVTLNVAGDCRAGFRNLAATTLLRLTFFFQLVVKVFLLAL